MHAGTVFWDRYYNGKLKSGKLPKRFLAVKYGRFDRSPTALIPAISRTSVLTSPETTAGLAS